MRKKSLFALALVLGLMGANASLGQTTIIVSPSGDTTGINDWNAITQAFADAEAAGPGSTVQLEAGTFYLHKGIAALDFSGTFKGAGKTATTIQTAPGVAFDFDPADSVPIMLAFYYDSDPVLRTLSISDMKLHITELTVEYYDRRPYTLNVAHGIMIMNSDVFSDGVSNVNASVENVEIEGTRDLPDVRGFWYGRPYDWKNNIFVGLAIWLGSGPSTCSIKNCHISNADVGLDTWTMLSGVINGNTVENGGVGLQCRYGDDQVISGNLFNNCDYGLYLNGCWGFHIENNIIACPLESPYSRQYEYGINLQSSCRNATIIGNHVLGDSQTTSYRYGIEATYSPNTIIAGNDVTAYRHAIVLDRFNWDSTISGNTATLLPSDATGYALYVDISDNTNILGNTSSGTVMSGLLLSRSANCIATQNRFPGLNATWEAVFVNQGGDHSILRNDYKEIVSGNCVTLWNSDDNMVFESGNFPLGTDAMMQVLDFGTNNRVIGHPADHVSDPGIGQEIQQVAAELAAMEEELIAAEAEQ